MVVAHGICISFGGISHSVVISQILVNVHGDAECLTQNKVYICY